MSQYFTYVNVTKREALNPPSSGPDPLAHVTDPVGTGMLSYLLVPGIRNMYDLATDYAGRWAGDDVRLVGDYAENDLYHALDDDWTYRIIATDSEEYHVGQTFTKTPPTRNAPVKETPELLGGEYLGRRAHTILDRDPKEGDIAYVRHPDPPYQYVYAELVKIAESDWTDITNHVNTEYESLVGTEWTETFNDSSRVIPSSVVGVQADGNPVIASGDAAALLIEGPDGYRNTTVDEYITNSNDPTEIYGDEYVFVSREHDEYIAPETGNEASGAVAQLTNAVGTGMVAFLLLQGKQDGTRFTSLYNPQSPPDHIQEAMSEKMEEERERHRNSGRSSAYRNNDGSWKKTTLIQAVAANYTITEENRFAGRWAGDSIELVPRANIPEEFIDITQGTRREFKAFAGEDWTETHEDSSIARMTSPRP